MNPFLKDELNELHCRMRNPEYYAKKEREEREEIHRQIAKNNSRINKLELEMKIDNYHSIIANELSIIREELTKINLREEGKIEKKKRDSLEIIVDMRKRAENMRKQVEKLNIDR